MSDDASVILQGLIDRMLQGDQVARRALLERACDRLRRLAARMLNSSFPAVRAQHELDSVVHETWLRLAQALEKTDPPTVADFFRLAAHKIRQVLLDMAERQRRLGQREVLGLGNPSSNGLPEPAQLTYNPARLALWTEFHQNVDTLEESERAVFDLHYYLEIPQAEIARLLELHPRKVSYLWISATEKLTARLDDLEGLL
ncbi:MAG: RNA polymerase sigma factor [Gemmataceae bacterium]